MSKANPELAIDALFPTPIEIGYGVTVYPLTLAHYALLEKINSYLIDGGHVPDAIEVVKTLYICTHPARETLADFDALADNAFEWAENLPPNATELITVAIRKQIEAMGKVVPITGDSDKKKLIPETVS